MTATPRRANVSLIEVEPLRKAFPNEALHFTTWLAEHIDALADRLGLELTVVEREKAVGDFSVDLLCEDARGQKVIVENQLERSDHDHLGKVLTYLVNLEASTAIWISGEPRPEHERVIDWLNESTPADLSFYLVKLEAVRIGDSPFAPLFTVISKPDTQGKLIGEAKKDMAALYQQRIAFWEELMRRAAARTKLFVNKTVAPSTWMGADAGLPGVKFVWAIAKNYVHTDLYIQYTSDPGEKNKRIFDALYTERDAIEGEFGGPLEWLRYDDNVASIIRIVDKRGGVADPDTWPAVQETMIDTLIRFERVFRPRLARIEL